MRGEDCKHRFITCLRLGVIDSAKKMQFALSTFSSSPLLPCRRRPTIASHGMWQQPVKAMVAESRDNSAHHLQRSTAKQQQQSQPFKRRTPASPPIGLWDRFPTARTIQQMMETMDRIMEDPFAYSTAPFPSTVGAGAGNGDPGYRRGRTPWEIKEGEGDYKIRFDMPGMTKEDVKVWVEEKMLVLKAEKTLKKVEKEGKEAAEQEQEEEEEWSALSYGRYNSRIALPDNVAVENIKAEVKDGVLYIALPKVSRASKILDIDVQ